MTFRYLSVCSGIEAATVAWHPLGWEAAAYSEIEKFPRAVLAHHYPGVPVHGDFTTIGDDEYGAIDLICGGTPCQDYSIAGLRGGLDGDRGNLTLEFSHLAYRKRARWMVWENVPGVFSTNRGRDFGAILATFSGRHGLVFEAPADGWRNSGIVEPADAASFGLAWRVLDAQYFGVPQRRRRIVLVGYLGDWRRAAAVLFERHGLQGHPAPRREAREAVAALTANGVGTCGADDNQGQAGHLIAHSLRGEGLDASEDGTGRGTPLVPVAIQERAVSENPNAGPDGAGFRTDGMAYTLEARTVPQAVAFSIMPMNSGKDYRARETDVAQPIMAGGPVGGNQGGDFVTQPVAFVQNSRDEVRNFGGDGQTVGALAAEAGMKQQCYIAASAVRRLTPPECERLQGFPDDYTQIPWRGKPADQCPDGPRYKALGNSWAVPKFAWLGRRIAMVEAMFSADREAA